MAAPSRCRTEPIPAAARRVRRTDQSIAAGASPAHHDDTGPLRVAGVAPHDVNIGWPLVERLPCLERDGSLAFQLHTDLAFAHVDQRMGVVPMHYALCTRRIRHLNHATLLARV